jgi:DNA-binding transcriptional ArsR family regulator
VPAAGHDLGDALLADPVRARILYVLDEAEELCVRDLALGVLS